MIGTKLSRNVASVKLDGVRWLDIRWRSSGSDDYQYLQRSRIPSLHFQKSLPRLPVPKLDDTVNRYLSALHPILDAPTFETTRRVCEAFRVGDGPRLHKTLLDFNKKNSHTSYLTEMWSDLYLSDRKPLPLNYNPFIVFGDFDRALDQSLTASNLIVSALRFMKSLRANILKPEVFHLNAKLSRSRVFDTYASLLPERVAWYGVFPFKAYPLDMSQHDFLFNTTRIPKHGKDMIYQDVNARHVLVMRNGNFYVFDVLDEQGNIHPPERIHGNVLAILNDPTPPSACPLGVLTTLDRNAWAKVRLVLSADASNERALKLIDNALFHVSLDDVNVRADREHMVRTFLHADGTNRWFDKSISLLVSKDAKAAVNFEHAWGDGVAVMRFMQDIHHDVNHNARVSASTRAEPRAPHLLQFNVNDAVKAAVTGAAADYARVCANLDVNYILSSKITKRMCVTSGVSPDAVAQLLFQCAYYRQNGRYVTTYESCSTSAFKHGRTEAIRPCTRATKEFSDKLHSGAAVDELKHLLKVSSQMHSKLTTEAAMGQGFDRHMFALRKMAENANETLPEVFRDVGYATINDNKLSTSTLQSPVIESGGFGPVTADGYGVGYYIKTEGVGVLATSYKDRANGREFIDCVGSCIDDLAKVLT